MFTCWHFKDLPNGIFFPFDLFNSCSKIEKDDKSAGEESDISDDDTGRRRLKQSDQSGSTSMLWIQPMRNQDPCNIPH